MGWGLRVSQHNIIAQSRVPRRVTVAVRIKEYMASPKLVQELTFKDIFRFAAQYGLIEDPSPWFEYQDSRNNTVHDYGENFADTVLKLIQRFYIDAVQLHLTLVQKHGV